MLAVGMYTRRLKLKLSGLLNVLELYINVNVGRLIASYPSLGQAAVIVLASVNNGVDTPDGAAGSSRGEFVLRSIYRKPW